MTWHIRKQETANNNDNNGEKNRRTARKEKEKRAGDEEEKVKNVYIRKGLEAEKRWESWREIGIRDAKKQTGHDYRYF